MYQYAIIDFVGRVVVPDAGNDYDKACELSHAITAGEVGHGVANLTWEYQVETRE